jgi:16S rRNA G966 N2-methylase RsmD
LHAIGSTILYKIKHFDDKLQEKEYVIYCNLVRRQLNAFQRIKLALRLKPILEERARRNSKANLKQNKDSSPSVRIQTVGIRVGRVDKEIAKHAAVGKDTVRKVEVIQEKASMEQLNKLDSGTDSIHSVYNDIEREEKRQVIINRATSSSYATANNNNKSFQLILSDFKKLGPKKIADNSVNLIFTDPPYEGEYLPIYDDLAKYAARTLVPGGSLITYLRQYDIPTIIRYMENAGLTYYWMVAVKLGGPFARAQSKNIVIKQKPLGWFVKGIRQIDRPTILESVVDLIDSSTPSEGKDLDDWAES